MRKQGEQVLACGTEIEGGKTEDERRVVNRYKEKGKGEEVGEREERGSGDGMFSVEDGWMNGVLGHFFALSRLNWAGDNLWRRGKIVFEKKYLQEVTYILSKIILHIILNYEWNKANCVHI